jgi:hypothetical protein
MPKGGTIDMPRRVRVLAVALAALLGAAAPAWAAEKFFAFNLTTATDIVGLFLAPEGTQDWGPNQALNDADSVLQPSERLKLIGLQRGRFDVKLQDRAGHICIKHGIDLTRDPTFDVRDADLADCH